MASASRENLTPSDVSIIIPCYNAAKTLPDTITSVRAQTHEQWEAICVDDGSTDRTPRLLDAFAHSDARIRFGSAPGPAKRHWTENLFSVPPRSPAAARNRGLSMARSDRVFFLDADDLLRPNALATLLKASKAAGDRAIVSAGFELLDQQGRPLSVFHFPSVPDFSVDALLLGNRLPPLTLVPRRLLGSRPFDEDQSKRGCEDWDLWLQLAQDGAGCVTLPQVLFGYRLRTGSLSHDADRMYASACRVLDQWMPLARDPEAARDAIHRLACNHGAIAAASGSSDSVTRYFAPLPPLDPTDGFHQAAAGGIYWAFMFVRGAKGATWREHGANWLVEIEEWLGAGPLTAHAEMILACLQEVIRQPRQGLSLLRDFVARRPDAGRVLVYGIGTNGATLLEQIRSDAALTRLKLDTADDRADALTFDVLGLPRDDPRLWDSWPPGTLAVITPNDHETMRATLSRAGGREGRDFIVLADVAEMVR